MSAKVHASHVTDGCASPAPLALFDLAAGRRLIDFGEEIQKLESANFHRFKSC